MIRHQTIAKHLETKTLMRFFQRGQKSFEVEFPKEDLLPTSAAVHDMVVGIFVFDS